MIAVFLGFYLIRQDEQTLFPQNECDDTHPARRRKPRDIAIN